MDPQVQRWIRHLLGLIEGTVPEQASEQRNALHDLLYVFRRLRIRPGDWDNAPQLLDDTVAVLSGVLHLHAQVDLLGDAAEILRLVGPGAHAAAPELLHRLQAGTWDGFERLRLQYVRCLAAIAPSHRRVVELFLDILEEDPPKPPVPNGEAVSQPIEQLEPVAALGAEDEEMAR